MFKADPVHNLFSTIGILTIVFLFIVAFSYGPMQFFTLVTNGWVGVTQSILR